MIWPKLDSYDVQQEKFVHLEWKHKDVHIRDEWIQRQNERLLFFFRLLVSLVLIVNRKAYLIDLLAWMNRRCQNIQAFVVGLLSLHNLTVELFAIRLSTETWGPDLHMVLIIWHVLQDSELCGGRH